MIIKQVAKAVIQEFAADGVKYLELRSTPREVTETGTGRYVKHLLAAHFCFCWHLFLSQKGLTKQRYIETVLEAIRQCKQEEVDIDVR